MPHVQHVAMQSDFTNIYERMGRSKELTEFERGAVIVCHHCNKSVGQISSLLDISRSAVSDIVEKWKHLGITATQPRSVRPCKVQIGS